MTPPQLRIEGHKFLDPQNREITLRGINVSGEAKYPKVPDIPSHKPEHFYDGDNVSFVGRPFPLEEADTHFVRMKKWGYNTLRYIFTWEAIEHAGPGKFDEEFISFTIEVLRLAGKHGFYVFMDPHQDVWSRISGGSGAPMWTLYAAGFDPRNFNATQAALVHNTSADPASYPKMIWTTNYNRLVCQTIFTLFWAGKDFAPKAIIDGKNIQDYLQGHFIAACKHLARRIREAGDLENDIVIGWESMNEPHRGMIGLQDISVIPSEQQLKLGTTPTAFQSILTGSGRACEVSTWATGGFGPYKTGRELVDPEGTIAWLSETYDDTYYGWKRDPQWRLGECLWAQHGVWDPTEGKLLRKDYFSKDPSTGSTLDYEGFINKYFMDHYRDFRDAIRSIHPGAIMFCQPPVMEVPPKLKGTQDEDPNMVHAVHYYDGLTLLTKHWNRLYNVDVIGVLRGKYLTPAFAVRIGETAIRNCLRDQLHFLREESFENMGDHPLIFSEIGIPYDMDDKAAYESGDYSSQTSAMDANHFALEGSGANGYTIWVYTSENNHQWGDMWNGEDLSLYSVDDRELPSNTSLGNASANQSSTSLDRNDPSFSESRSNPDTSSIQPDNLKTALTTPKIVSEPSQESSNPGAKLGFRSAEAYIRPSPIVTHGTIQEYGFDLQNCTFTLSLTAPSATPEDAPTEIYLPDFHFPTRHTVVAVSGGKWTIEGGEMVESGSIQRLRWWHSEGEQDIKIDGLKRKVGELVEAGEDDGYLEQCQQSSCVLM